MQLQRLSDEDLVAMAVLSHGVPAGPWRVVRGEYPQLIADLTGRVVARTYTPTSEGGHLAEFIASAGQGVPRLVDELQQARAGLARARRSFRLMAAAAALAGAVAVVLAVVVSGG